jgi:hypothetical protein
MNYFLIVDELDAEPGIYGSSFTKKELMELVSKIDQKIISQAQYPELFFDLREQIIKSLESKESFDEFIKISPNTTFNERFFGTSIFYRKDIEQYIVLPANLIKSYKGYKNKMFSGAFKTPNHLEAVLPQDSGKQLVILQRASAKVLFPENDLEEGLNIFISNTNEILPLSEFSIKKWKKLTSQLQACFLNLGAKIIEFEEISHTENFNKVEVKTLKKLSSRFDTEFEMESNFHFRTELNNPVYNPQKAERYLDSFKNELPHTYELAQFAINEKVSGEMNTEESLDLSFKVSLEVLSAFQGSFKGGFRKSFKVKITF